MRGQEFLSIGIHFELAMDWINLRTLFPNQHLHSRNKRNLIVVIARQQQQITNRQQFTVFFHSVLTFAYKSPR